MFNRKFRLELSGPDIDIGPIEELRMDFKRAEYFAVGDLTNMADTFDLDIYNLSPTTYKAMASSKEVKIKFYTGYEDEDILDLAFEGIVTNVTGRRQIPEHITTLWCIPKGLLKANKNIGYTGNRKDTVRSVLEEIASQLSLKINFEGVDDVIDKPFRGHTLEGAGIESIIEMGKQYFFMPRVEDDELRIITLPEKDSIKKIKKAPIVLKADRMRGTPKASVAKLSIPYAFNTDIRTGDVIDVTKLEGSVNNTLTGGIGNPNGIVNVSGLGSGSLHYSDTLYKWAIQSSYQIIAATHAGSNYTDQYISNYECVVYINNRKGV